MDNVPAAAQTTIGAQGHTVAQPIQHQDLLGFGETDFPRQSGGFDRGNRRSARPSLVATDQNDVGIGLGDARCDGPDAGFRHKLHADPGPRIHLFQIMDELGEILDGINVMMRRRRNQTNTRS